MFFLKLPHLQKNNYIIYTKSKCIYCDKIKELFSEYKLTPQFINCDKFLNNEENKEKFLISINEKIKKYSVSPHNTFPIVFLGEKFIGGYNESIQYLYNLYNLNLKIL